MPPTGDGWDRPDLVADAEEWTVRVLAEAGIGVTGRLTEHVTTPWSMIGTIATDRGRVWFKQNSPARLTEGPLHAALAAMAPELVDAPLAVDASRSWTLTADAGTTVRYSGPEGNRGIEPEILVPLLRDYAELQRLSLGWERELRHAGLPATDPRCTADVARTQADMMAGLPEDDPRHLTGEQRDQVLAALPALTESSEALLSGPVPLAFDHGDLWPDNALPPRSAGGRYRFFDFAEAQWAHPFGSLIMFVVECRYRWKISGPEQVIDCRDPRMRRVFDAYLSCWDDLAALPELRELAQHALRIAAVHRSTVWFRALDNADDTALTKHGGTPWAWLQDVTKPVML